MLVRRCRQKWKGVHCQFRRQKQGGCYARGYSNLLGCSDGTKLIDLLQERKNEVEALIRSVQGFVSYSLIIPPMAGLP